MASELLPPQTEEYSRFLALSEELGKNLLLVQAAGGNTSLKHSGHLWVKASGTWLADATSRAIMVPVDLVALRQALAQNDARAEHPQNFSLGPEGGLRPSIETVVHAVMPQKVVLHVHCVETIAWAVQTEAEALLAERLAGENWALIPYTRPGLPLAQAIQQQMTPETRVLILGNHGLVVAGDTLDEARQRLYSVHHQLARPRRPDSAAPVAELREAAAHTPYRLAEESVHSLAMDPLSLKLGADGSMYPDHVIFLGSGLSVLPTGASFSDYLQRFGDAPPKAVVLENTGVLIHEEAPRGIDEMLLGLKEITARLNAHDAVRKLQVDEEAALLNWDAEKYRQLLAQRQEQVA